MERRSGTDHPPSGDRDHVPAAPLAAAFASNALVWGSVVPRIPDIADRLDASPGEIAVPLFAYMAGGLVSSWTSASVLARRSPAWAHTIGIAVGAVCVALGVMSSTLWVVSVLFAAAGAGDGLQDVAMNAGGVDLEDARGRSFLQRLHAVWSLGFLSAAAIGAGATAVDVGVATHVATMCGVAVLLGVWAGGGFPPPHGHEAPAGGGGGRIGPLLALVGVATGFGALMELIPNDWSALYLRDELGAAPGLAALGPVAFMAGMVAGRLGGDRVVGRLGPARTLTASAALVAVALTAGLAPGRPVPALVGVGVAGLGAAFTFPGLFSLAAREGGSGRARGLAVVSTVGRLGFVVGPLLAGGVAEIASLRWALHVAVFAAVVVVGVGGWLGRAHRPPAGSGS